MDRLISPSQCAAARNALGWDRTQLSDAAYGITTETIRRFEGGSTVTTRTIKTLQTALEAAGIQFNKTKDTQSVTWGN